MKRLISTVVLALVSCVANAAKHNTYHIQLDEEHALIKVKACFHGSRPPYLSTGRSASGQYFVTDSLENIQPSPDGGKVYLRDDCIAYQVDLTLAMAERQARQKNGYWLVNNRSWFWRPASQTSLQLHFTNGQGNPANVSVPWRKDGNKYLAGLTPLGWTSRMMFGDIETQQLSVGEKQVNVAQTLDIPDNKRALLNDWIIEAAGSVASLYGHFPVNHTQILIVPIGKRREAVPWAEVQRAGQPSVHLFIDPTRPIDEFKADWTAVHELSHLLVPRIDYNDRWLSEGLASYYQNVAKARAGLLQPKEAWGKLRAGFAQGRRAMSGSLRSSRSTKHLYWGGAAFYMLADVRLRERPVAQTLDQVLAKLYQCCLPSDKLWQASEFMARLDELSQTQIFSQLLENEATANRFPISVVDESSKDTQITKHIDAIFQAN